MKKLRIYADTSIFRGVFDSEFSEKTKAFFSYIDNGEFDLVTSAVVEAEIEPAPEDVRILFSKYAIGEGRPPVLKVTLSSVFQTVRCEGLIYSP